MMSKMRRLSATLFASFMVLFASAQEGISPLEGTFFESGKMWVVVAVGAVILTGIFVYLISLGVKVKALEEELNKK